MEICNNASVDVLKLCIIITEAFSFEAYNDFKKAGLAKKLPVNLEREMFYSYKKINILQNMIRENLYALKFYSGYKENQDLANKDFQNSKIYCIAVNGLLEKIIGELNIFYNKKLNE